MVNSEQKLHEFVHIVFRAATVRLRLLTCRLSRKADAFPNTFKKLYPSLQVGELSVVQDA